MLVTLLGISTEVKLVRPEKARSPMLVTLLGMVVFGQPAINVLLSLSMIALQLSLESYLGLLGATTIDVKLEQSQKVPQPMLVTLLGISTEVKLEQL